MKTNLFFLLFILIAMQVALMSCSASLEDNLYEDYIRKENSSARSDDTDYYYWYKGEKIFLSSLRDIYYVSSSDSISLTKALAQSKRISVNEVLKQGVEYDEEKRFWSLIKTRKMGMLTSTKEIITEFANEKVYIAPVFGSSMQDCVSTSEFFYVKIKGQDKTILEEFAKKYSVEIIKEFPYMPEWFVLKSPLGSNGLLMSNLFYESGYFEDVDPAFMFNFGINECPNEPNISEQWSVNKTDLCAAWDISKGDRNIVVAIIDTGVDQNHREFANNYNSKSFDLINMTSPSIVRGEHGTHVGGIIGAEHNQIQIAGVSPDISIMSISHPLNTNRPNISQELASGISYAYKNGASIINNSWGDQGGELYEYLHSASLEEAINSAIRIGRNGKGTIVLFAAGNKHRNGVDYPANCNKDILVVGSIDETNERSYFSSYGSSLDVVAPGSNILSTLPNNRIGIMSGTSMSTPFVAGVAALILSVDSELTGKDVVNIIESTSQKIGDYKYSVTREHSSSTWNNEMGYGMCNAFAAVSKARSKPVLFNSQNVSEDTSVSGWIIQTRDVKVNPNVKLMYNLGESITIGTPFTVELGAELEISFN